VRDIIALACTACQRRNYSTTKNKRTHPDRLELKKYCRWCKKHTPHLTASPSDGATDMPDTSRACLFVAVMGRGPWSVVRHEAATRE
jgi:large subunit ribosomal protein L33